MFFRRPGTLGAGFGGGGGFIFMANWLSPTSSNNPTNGQLSINATSDTVTLPTAPADKTYIAVKSSNGGTTVAAGAGDAIDTLNGLTASSIPLGIGQGTVLVYDAISNTWWQVARAEAEQAYSWTWADAAARLAETVASEQIGLVGFQQDIAREYVLEALTGGQPNSWGERPDPRLGPPRFVAGQNNGVMASFGTATTTAFGTLANRTPAGASRSQALARIANNTSAVAGNIAVHRGTGASQAIVSAETGLRATFYGVLGAVSASMRWFMGLSADTFAANIDPGSRVNTIGIGRGNGEANVQLYHNNGAGVATQIDLGGDFPAATLDSGYELQLYTLDGASYGVQVRALNGNFEQSFTLSSELPVLTWLPTFIFYASNNADAAAVSLDIGYYTYQQITR